MKTSSHIKQTALLSALLVLGAAMRAEAQNTITLLTGTLAGQAVSAAQPEINVSAGAAITGSFQVRVHNEMPPSAIAPLAATTTWGTPSSSYWQVQGWVNIGDSTHTVPVNVTAPTTAGTYYIVAAMAGTYNSAQIMSGTHPGWTADWVNGNKVALLPAATIESGMVNGWIPFDWYSPIGPLPGQLGLNAVRVVVSDGGTNDPSGWSVVGNLASARGTLTATLLDNGKVLLTGGIQPSSGTTLASCELFDPATLTVTAAASMAQPRNHHQAVKLPNGKVLVVGGNSPTGSYLGSCELYDPIANTWSPAASMLTPASAHRLALLDNGKVLRVCGPTPSGFGTTICELYDPATDSWSYTGSTAVGGHSRAAVKLLDGRVLTAGGYMFNNDVEVYDPATGNWSVVGALQNWVGENSAIQLNDQRVFIMGGIYWSGIHYYYRSVDVYDPVTGLVSPGPNMLTPRANFGVVKLPNGDVLAIGGTTGDGVNMSTTACDRYDVTAGAWQAGPALNHPRAYFEVIQTGNKVFVFGGFHNGPSSSVAVSSIEMLVVGATNQPPVPQIAVGPLAEFPGLDRNLIIAANGHNASVTLDGSLTTDPENDPLSFVWYDGAILLGTNVTTTTLLAVGAHTITLQVNDGVNTVAVEADVEVITLAQAVEVIMELLDETTLNVRTRHPLKVSLNAAQASFARGNLISGINQMRAFQNKVKAMVVRRGMSEGSELMQAAQIVMDAASPAKVPQRSRR